MGRPRTGSHVFRDGQLYAKVSYKDEETGKRRVKERRVPSNKLTDAPAIIRQLENELAASGPDAFEADRVSFEVAARAYKKAHVRPARMENGKKVEGLKNTKDPERWVEILIKHFGATPIKKLTYDDLRQYKARRMKTVSARGRLLATASVNRELEILRAIFRFAIAKGWIHRNPFAAGKPLINKSDEQQRMTILTPEQEGRILARCSGRRAHLFPFVIVAIDTFMRSGELFALRKLDIDFAERCVRVYGSKTDQMRQVGLTPRALSELQRLTVYLKDEDKVFALGSVKKSWASACKLAGVKDVRVHDLRHTGITRRLEAVVGAKLPWQLVMKEAGHSSFKTFMRYFNPDLKLLARAAEAMSELYPGQLLELGGQSVPLTHTPHSYSADFAPNSLMFPTHSFEGPR